jgi:hypothetical protein
MNVSSVAGVPSSAFYSASNPSQMQQAWQDLGKNLDSGNLSAARDNFDALQKMSSLFANSSSSSSSQLSRDIAALGSALDANNLSDAKSAYSTVEKDLGGKALQIALKNADSDRRTSNEIDMVTSAISDNSGTYGGSSSTSSDSTATSDSSVEVYA